MEEKILDLPKILADMDGDLVAAIKAAKIAWINAGGENRTKEYLAGRAEILRDRLYEVSGISQEDIDEKTLEAFEVTAANRDAHLLVKSYLDHYPSSTENGLGFILMGDLGIGKTHLCIAFLVELIKRHQVRCEYANVKAVLDAEKGSFDTHTEGPLDRLRCIDLLCLDDLGSERATQWTLDAISTIVTYRYNNRLPTIFTTNAIGFDALTKTLSGSQGTFAAERIVDRIKERNEPAIIRGNTRRQTLVRFLRGKILR